MFEPSAFHFLYNCCMTSLERTKLLIGENAIETLKKSHVAIFGVGGVGGYVCEALVRCGVGEFTLVDNDVVSISNINRQIIATTKTVGQYKVDVMKQRMEEINPDVKVNVYKEFFLPETSSKFDFKEFDYVVDAIDTVTGKIEIILKAKENDVKVISSMGTGNKLNPNEFIVSDIYKTEMCPLAKVMRKELKARRVKKCKVVYSKEKPIEVNVEGMDVPKGKRSIPGSIAFVPSSAGLLIASEVVKDLIQGE